MYWWISCFKTPIIEEIDQAEYDAVCPPDGRPDSDLVVTITITNADEIIERAVLEVVAKAKDLVD